MKKYKNETRRGRSGDPALKNPGASHRLVKDRRRPVKLSGRERIDTDPWFF